MDTPPVDRKYNKKKDKTYISIDQLLENNREWAQKQKERHPTFFTELAAQQNPQILWIGCSDSRVPSNQILKLNPGQVFTHRNIANVVTHTVLKVRHIIVCGHYGCGGVMAAESNKQFGLIDNWLRHIKDVYIANKEVLDETPSGTERTNLLIELNVARSVLNVCHTSIVQNAWAKGQILDVQGWVYGLDNGLITPLGLNISHPKQIDKIFLTQDSFAVDLALRHSDSPSLLRKSSSSLPVIRENKEHHHDDPLKRVQHQAHTDHCCVDKK